MSRLDYYGLVLEVKTINNEQLLLKVLTPDAIIDFVEVNLKRFTKEEISKISIYNTIVLYNNLSKINHPVIKLNVPFLSMFDDIKNYSLGYFIQIPTNDNNLINLNSYVDDLSFLGMLLKNLKKLDLFYRCLWFDKFACGSKM